MLESIAPSTVEELRDAVLDCGQQQASVETGGSFSKRLHGGPVAPAARRIQTTRLNRLLAYEPADLTVSVEAGMRISELSRILARNRQFLPLDPPFFQDATIGGVLAANASGSRRRRFGTARDMAIGMRFVTLDGKLVSSGGMVVKNVTGLDMTKLMIGSFGTLAVIASANFKVFPAPDSSVSFLFQHQAPEPLLEVRSRILASQLQPTAIDWLDPRAARLLGVSGAHSLLVEASGTEAVTRRYKDEFEALSRAAAVRCNAVSGDCWERVRELGAEWLAANPDGALVRGSTVLSRLDDLLRVADQTGCAALLRAGNASGMLMAEESEGARAALDGLRSLGVKATLEAAADDLKGTLQQWSPRPSELLLMQRIKADFDPLMLLNRGRLFGLL